MKIYSVKWDENILVALVIAIFSLSITVPYIYAAQTPPEGHVFSGWLVLANDQNVYLSWAKQAQEGHFFFRNLFTNELVASTEQPRFFHLFSWCVGITARYLPLSLLESYHLFRVLFAAFGLKWFYDLCREITENQHARLIAVLLLAFSSGVGGLVSIFFPVNMMDTPGTTMKAEAFYFFSALAFGINTFSMALLILVYLWMIKFIKHQNTLYLVGACIGIILVGNTHPYDNLPFIATLLLIFIDLLADGRRYKLGFDSENRRILIALFFLICAAALPVLSLYYIIVSSTDFRTKANFLISSPPLISLVLSYGPLVPLLILSAVKYGSQRNIRILSYWFLMCCSLIYVPAAWAGKLIEGIHIPLCILAALGLTRITCRLPKPLHIITPAIVVFLMCISTLRYMIWLKSDIQSDRSTEDYFLLAPSYLAQDDISTLNFISRQKSSFSVVLALPFIGSYVPSLTGKYTYVGHASETFNYWGNNGKLNQVLQFYFTPVPQSDALMWLRRNHIKYVIEGHYENKIARQLNASLPSVRYKLPLILRHGQSSIYGVPSS